MRRFSFRLQSVLEWRVTQLELEESKLETLFAELRRIEAALRATEAGRAEAELAVLGSEQVNGQELQALGVHCLHLSRQRERLEQERASCERRITAQRVRVLEAERNLRLLEKLKERRFAEWRAESEREQENLVSEIFLSQWRRR